MRRTARQAGFPGGWARDVSLRCRTVVRRGSYMRWERVRAAVPLGRRAGEADPERCVMTVYLRCPGTDRFGPRGRWPDCQSPVFDPLGLGPVADHRGSRFRRRRVVGSIKTIDFREPFARDLPRKRHGAPFDGAHRIDRIFADALISGFRSRKIHPEPAAWRS